MKLKIWTIIISLALLLTLIFGIYKSTHFINKSNEVPLSFVNEVFKPGIYNETLQVGGVERSYSINFPTGYKSNTTYPLVILLHDKGEVGMDIIKYSNFIQLSNQQDFILITPNGINKSWNYSNNQNDYTNGIDDVGFISKLIDTAKTKFSVNNWKVYVTGYATGGLMSLRLSCELSDKITSIAIVGASFTRGDIDSCNPTTGISIAIFNGTNDIIFPYQGGSITSNLLKEEIVANDTTVRFWVNYNKDRPDPDEIYLPKDLTNNGIYIEKEVYSGISPVILYKINGGEHKWYEGNSKDTIQTSELIWEFFNLSN